MFPISRRTALKTGAAWTASSALGSYSPAVFAAAGPYDDAKLLEGEPAPMQKGSFTLVVLPDTQNYSELYPEQYHAQTSWIVEHRRARNIGCVLHLGDVTNHNTPPEWENAVKAMDRLDGHVPYFMVPGNHDYSERGFCVDRDCGLSKYFPVDKLRERPTFGGVYDREPTRSENSYHLFSINGKDFLVIGLEFGPRKDVVRWANEVATKHKDRAAILITHAYMYSDETRYDWQTHGKKQAWNPHTYGVAKATNDDVFDGEQLWQELVSKHENFVCTLNGHVLNDGLGRTVTATPGKRNVHQMLVNFQMKPNGGDGWLRLLEFRADGRTVLVSDYSPTLNQRNESPQNHFELQLE